jgi:hypothetical protein
MTISAISPIYDFKQFSQAAGERHVARAAFTSEPTEHQLDLFDAQAMPSTKPAARRQDEAVEQKEQITSVSKLFDRFFQDKIDRFDTDEDGRLGAEEFYGSQEQFASLDLNEDGYISAADLKRQFMEANPEIREMSEGFAHELYDQILKSGNSGPEELARMVESFFADFVEQSDENQDEYLTAAEFPGTVNEFKNIAGALKHGVTQEDLIGSFHNDNPDLVELRESLLGLKDMVKQNNEVRPRHIDMYA